MKKISIDLKKLETKLNYTFIDQNLLLTALTHTSYINEQGKAASKNISLHNERLEYLGDAVLELVISEELFLRYPIHREGLLTDSRSGLVNEKTLASLAQQLELNKFIRLGKGEENQGGRIRPSTLSDAFEAVLAAIYLDARQNPLYPDPLDPVRNLMHACYRELWMTDLKPKLSKDYKTLLQELTQNLFKDTPRYALISSEGPEHKKIFTIKLTLPTGKEIIQSGGSKKNAEQLAAAKALEFLM